MRGAVDGFFPDAVYFSPIVHSLAILFMLGFSSVAVSAADEVKILAPDAVVFKADANIPGVAIALIAGNPKQGAYTMRANNHRR